MKFILLMLLLCSCQFTKSEYIASPTHNQQSIHTVEPVNFDIEVLQEKHLNDGHYRRLSIKAHNNLILKSDRFIKIRLFIHNKGRRPLLLVQPISRGSYHISTFVAKSFFKRGWNTMIVEREDRYKKLYDPEKINLQMKETILDSRQIIDWLYYQRNFSISHLAIFGISKGGIKASLIMGDDSRVEAGIIALAGGDLPSILSESNEKGVSRVRNHYIKDQKVSVKKFKETLQEQFTVDPLLSAKNIDGRKTLHILAYFDTSVPYRYGRRLYDAMPGASLYTLTAGHYSAILYLPFILNRSEAFLNIKLGLDN